MLTSLGRLSIGQLQIGLSGVLPGLKLRLDEARGVKASIAANIDKSLGLNINIDALLAGFNPSAALQFKLPDIGKLGAQIQADVDLLNTKLGKIQLQIDAFQSAIGASAAAWNYTGPTNAFAGQLGTAVSALGGSIDALILTCSEPALWAALGALLYVGSSGANGTLNSLLKLVPGLNHFSPCIIIIHDSFFYLFMVMALFENIHQYV